METAGLAVARVGVLPATPINDDDGFDAVDGVTDNIDDGTKVTVAGLEGTGFTSIVTGIVVVAVIVGFGFTAGDGFGMFTAGDDGLETAITGFDMFTTGLDTTTTGFDTLTTGLGTLWQASKLRR